jgi:hypothetical protein
MDMRTGGYSASVAIDSTPAASETCARVSAPIEEFAASFRCLFMILRNNKEEAQKTGAQALLIGEAIKLGRRACAQARLLTHPPTVHELTDYYGRASIKSATFDTNDAKMDGIVASALGFYACVIEGRPDDKLAAWLKEMGDGEADKICLVGELRDMFAVAAKTAMPAASVPPSETPPRQMAAGNAGASAGAPACGPR